MMVSLPCRGLFPIFLLLAVACLGAWARPSCWRIPGTATDWEGEPPGEPFAAAGLCGSAGASPSHAAPTSPTGSQRAHALVSPDGRTRVTIGADGELRWSVDRGGQPVLLDAPLGLEFKGAPPLGRGLVVSGEERREIDGTWKPVYGKRSVVRDHARELTLHLVEGAAPKRRLEVIVRAYDDGVALRSLLPRQDGLDALVLTREATHFRFPGDPTVWAADYGGFASSQEGQFTRKRVSSIGTNATAATPMLVQVRPTCWAAITEAELVDWPGMYLAGTPPPAAALKGTRRGGEGSSSFSTTLVTRLSPLRNDPDHALVRATAPHACPWRVLMLGERPGDLIQSDLVANLSAPCAIADTRWIHPGKCAWDHWWSGDVKMDTATMNEYVQFAADMDFPYQLVDWQWYGSFAKPDSDITHVNPHLDMEELRRFAKERGVRLLVWLHSADVDRKLRAGQLDDAFALYERWGLAGVKIDFMDRDDQEMVNWYHTVIAKAAAHHLLVDFHGAYKPTGTQRTWPNQITREGVLGEEYDKFSKLCTPEHDCTLPFTRMLAGPMDYTPGGFLNRSRARWRQTTPTEVQGTRCHELAKFVIFDSPLTVLCDDPVHYRGQVGVEFLKRVPTTWDETKAPDGAPGEFVVMARRSGHDWFLGAMTNWDPRTLSSPLTFLGPGRWTAHLWRDAPDAGEEATHALEETREVTSQETLSIPLASGGGLAVWFTPAARP